MFKVGDDVAIGAPSQGESTTPPATTMHLVPTHDPDTLDIQSTRTPLHILGGGVFAFFGASLTLGYIRPVSGPSMVEEILAITMGAIGFWCLFGRSGATVDRRNGLITRWWSIGVRLFERTRPIDAHLVHLGKDWIADDERPATTYAITLIGTSASYPVAFCNAVGEVQAVGDALSRFIELPLLDETGHADTRRTWPRPIRRSPDGTTTP